MRTGQRDTLVTVEMKSVTQDSSYGSEVVSWVEYRQVWARIVDQYAVEKLTKDVRTLTRVLLVEVLYDAGITADMRLRINETGRLLNILSIAEMPRREGLTLRCEEYST